MNVFEQRIEKAVDIGIRYGQIDGDHHKTWVIDQMLRALLAHKYDQEIEENSDAEHPWNVGIAP